jgi:hypothetical protein
MRSILLAASAVALLSGPVLAQSSQSNSGSNATVNTLSGSQSQSIANPKVNVVGNPIGNGASSSNSGAKAVSNTRSSSRSAAVGNTTNVTVTGYAGVSNSGYSGNSGSSGQGASGGSSNGSGATGDPATSGGYLNYGGSYTVRNTPELIPPSVVGGNPCSVGASGGVSLPGFGVALGGTWADRACERRQQAALLFNMGEQKVAMELMCQDDSVRAAMRTSGKPCTTDTVPVAQAPAAPPPVAVQPVPAVTVAHAAPLAIAQAAPPVPGWCAKAAPTTDASKAYVEQVCGR